MQKPTIYSEDGVRWLSDSREPVQYQLNCRCPRCRHGVRRVLGLSYDAPDEIVHDRLRDLELVPMEG